MSGCCEHSVCGPAQVCGPRAEAERHRQEKGCMANEAGEETKTKIDASVLSSSPKLIHSATRSFAFPKDRMGGARAGDGPSGKRTQGLSTCVEKEMEIKRGEK